MARKRFIQSTSRNEFVSKRSCGVELELEGEPGSHQKLRQFYGPSTISSTSSQAIVSLAESPRKPPLNPTCTLTNLMGPAPPSGPLCRLSVSALVTNDSQHFLCQISERRNKTGKASSWVNGLMCHLPILGQVPCLSQYRLQGRQDIGTESPSLYWGGYTEGGPRASRLYNSHL